MAEDNLQPQVDSHASQPPPMNELFDSIGNLASESITNKPALVEGIRPEDLMLPSDMEQIERIRQEAAKSREATYGEINIILGNADDLQKRREAGALAGTEAVEQSLRGSAQRLAAEEEKKRRLFIESNGTAARLAAESNLDNKSNLYTAKALADVASRRILEWWDGKRGSLRSIKIRLTDRMLFHFGNESLTMAGFDTRIGTEADGQIALSRALATDSKDLYKPHKSDDDLATDPSIQRYFPEGSDQRTTLELLREKVKVIPIRVNANGGDEFAQLIELPERGQREAQRAAVGLVEHVTRSTTLIPGTEVLDKQNPRKLTEADINVRIGGENIGNEKPSYYRHFYNATNQLMISRFDPDDPKRPPDNLIRYYNDFAGELRNHLWNDKEFRDKFKDPMIEARMEDAVALLDNGELPSLDDAMVAFCYGTDSFGNRFIDSKREPTFGLLTPDGKIDEEKVTRYSDSLAKKIRASASEVELQDPARLRSLVQVTFARDISAQFIELLNIRVNEISKKQKKADVAFQAFAGIDPQAAFTVGVTQASKREFMGGFSNRERFDLLKRIHDHYERVLDRPDNELTDHQLRLKRKMQEAKAYNKLNEN